MTRLQRLLTLALASASSCVALAQTGAAQTGATTAQTFVAPRHDELTAAFMQFLSLPNVAADPTGLRRNADFLVAQLQQRGLTAKLLTAPDAPATTPPVVWGELKSPGATRTIVFYAHYDGQPVTPAEWDTGKPFVPLLKQVNGEARVYARGAGDDKAAIFAQLTALSALQAAHLAPRVNLRFVWEGEEEAGSAHLAQILNANRDLISGDLWLVCDGPVDQTGRQTVVFGARGDAHLQITLYGPNRPLHSGHYGNWAPNPAMLLVQLLAGMKDATGKVLIPHFYDGIAPLGPLERQALADAPVNDAMLRDTFALGTTDGAGRHLLDLLNEPSLNLNGISSGQTGARSTNSIPSTATANLDMRLVVGVDGRAEQQRVTDYIRSQGFFITQAEPTHAELVQHPKVARIVADTPEPAVRTPMDLPLAADVIHAVESARGPVILLPTMGGTVPLEAMERAAHTRTITVPIANFDDNQHAANENLRLANLWDGIGTMAALMTMP